MNGVQPEHSPPLPEVVTTYLDRLTSFHPGITAIWLFGSRANGMGKTESDWDFLVFGDHAILDAISADETFRRPDIDLFIVHDGNRFESPWPGGDGTKLRRLITSFDSDLDLFVYGYRWQQISANEATYLSTWDFDCTDELRACRVYPR